MIYRGKDHKDIYFQGKYHDAMYLGYELLWYKIRKEGYCSLIVDNGKEGRFEKGLYVITFDENTRDFTIVMEILDNPDMYTESYFGGFHTVDRYTTYICSISGDDTVWASTDGIHFEKTNLIVKSTTDASFRFFYSASYFEDYVWYMESNGSEYVIKRMTITKDRNQYSIEYKEINTGLRSANPYPSYNASFSMQVPRYGSVRFALHTENRRYTSFGEEYEEFTVKYYDTELETSGNILHFQYKSGTRLVIARNYSSVNGHYVFFLRDVYSELIENGGWCSQEREYIFYSNNGITYENSIIYDKTIISHANDEAPLTELILYRKGMYYIYAGAEIDEYYNPPYTLFLTTDFKHFQKKKIPHEIKIGEETINTLKLIRAEAAVTNKKRRYFYFGEVSEPEDGILTIYEDSLVYIDNMFFKESNGNKIFHYKEG